ncbi:Monodehydroascorbate reductase [Galdieria sulphuraria]|uniref:monodehydroascorbate reductase (NADH) n=1 Tax=Galdieria sulphuraria TaxID=130081 RepID=M2Y0L2_GALSU|nr:monodehydroascorbate reductase (NADH) [Galdieria sulphuraria]EME29458.1 monodehydroascorbate reductase (NADH) [Galdieria sulphuraria]GJD06029.1 Monodehydroascorbate reductase [Galdieria sulphuraria]|eukprot:XP_005705978.1 monodehydroascorbate reductase (NADH) [Galdieria sulphuraria]
MADIGRLPAFLQPWCIQNNICLQSRKPLHYYRHCCAYKPKILKEDYGLGFWQTPNWNSLSWSKPVYRSFAKNSNRKISFLLYCCLESKNYQIIVLGGGVAAGYAAFSYVRMGGESNQLAVLSEEPVPPYERPSLSKGFMDPDIRMEPSEFYTCAAIAQLPQDEKWYEEHGVALYLNTRAQQVDVSTKKIISENGHIFHYEKLIIATGCRARKYSPSQVPFSNLDGILYLRNIEDANIVRNWIDELKGQGKAVVIGGGYLAMEITSCLVSNNIQVTMAYPGDYLLNKLFPAQVAKQYEQVFRDKGVELLSNCFVENFYERNDGFASAVRFQDGRKVSGDFFIVCIGAIPNTELFQGQLQLQNGGIEVNHRLQCVGFPDIYAVGDVASFPLKAYSNRPVRIEHVDHSRKSAASAILDILHGNPYGNTKHRDDPRLSIFRAAVDTTYDYVPFYYSRMFDLCWNFYGDSSGTAFVWGYVPSKMVTLWIELSSKVVGILLEGCSPFEHRVAYRVAVNRPKVDTSELQRITEASQVFEYLLNLLPEKVEKIRTTREESVDK